MGCASSKPAVDEGPPCPAAKGGVKHVPVALTETHSSGISESERFSSLHTASSTSTIHSRASSPGGVEQPTETAQEGQVQAKVNEGETAVAVYAEGRSLSTVEAMECGKQEEVQKEALEQGNAKEPSMETLNAEHKPDAAAQPHRDEQPKALNEGAQHPSGQQLAEAQQPSKEQQPAPAKSKSEASWEDASWWTDETASLAKAIPFLSYALVEAATGSFCHPLGEGGYGKVFKGRIRRRENGETSTLDVAVKVLWSETFEAQAEFMSEMKAVHRLEHKNVVRLVAACTDQMKALIYEFMPNGDVEHLIWRCQHGESTFPWMARLAVAVGAAEALEFIHSHDYIHRDFKAGNVLLDKDLNPKVADFGLAKGVVDWSTHVSTRIMGTAGYIDPQYFLTGHLHIKSDVYSFGVFLVELLTTKLVSQDSIQDDLIPALLKAEITEMPAMLAPEVIIESRRKDSVSVAFIARHCLHQDWDGRPFMAQVAKKLRRIYEEARESLERKAQAHAQSA